MTQRGATHAPNTSINHQGTEEQLQREFADVVAEQNQAAIEALDERQRFAMFATWQPAAKAMSDQLAIAGLPDDSVTVEQLAGFKGFFVAKPATIDSAAGWCFRLVAWVKRERVKAAGNASSAATDEFDDDNTEWMNGGSK
jgi:hypothetical protein